ncbi:MAG: type IV toxin-antitoxin system AbiEi family antitoxin domain-containing protein [Ilumatobacteraceae bacterium]
MVARRLPPVDISNIPEEAMPSWQPTLDEWFRSHLGVVSAQQMVTLGCPVRTIHRMVARGELVRMQRGVYRTSQWPDERPQQLAALCATGPDVIIGLTTALKEWGLRRVDDMRLHVLTPHSASPDVVGAVVHRCRKIDPVDIVERPDGIRLTSPPRSLFDSADILGVSAARSVLEQLINDGKCTLGTFIDTTIRLGHPSRPGSRTIREVIASRPKWRKALQSDLEQRVLAEIERQALPAPVSQCPLQLPHGPLIHLDFGWPDFRVGLEVDDPAWHAGFEERHRDIGRDRKAITLGWAVPRVSKIDVDCQLRDAISDVKATLALRGCLT